MRDLLDILHAFEQMAPDETGVLASIVHAAGSTYRRIGGRVFVAPDDSMTGLISGGCLESDLLARARAVRASGAACLVRYDASAEDDIVWGLGLGCAGVVDVLVEPVTRARPGPLAWLAAWRRARATGVIATCLSPERLGERVVLHPDGRVERAGGPFGGSVEASANASDDALWQAMQRALTTRRSHRIESPAGAWSLEVARPPLRLVLFGAGPDAVPVVRLATLLGWDVDVVDHRPAYARAERLPGARVQHARAEDAVAQAGVDVDSFVLVMTHHYDVDRTLLAGLLATPAPYVGVLGPKQRLDDLVADLGAQGTPVAEEDRARLHGPAGLDLGGEGPEAIALSLLAQVMAEAERRPGGALRLRKGPIHEPERA